jgi:hypothetical protein
MKTNKKIYQPKLEEDLWGTPEGLYSFECYRTKKACLRDFPNNEVIEYNEDDIENPIIYD